MRLPLRLLALTTLAGLVAGQTCYLGTQISEASRPAMPPEWWPLNRDRYLGLKSRIHAPVSMSEADVCFPDPVDSRVMTLAPSRGQVHELVVPALERVLDSDFELFEPALIALAKIGVTSGETSIENRILALLNDPSERAAGTAVLALGILGQETSVPVLARWVHADDDDPTTDRAEVPDRTRALAAYALGLIADRDSNKGARQRIATHLVQVLTNDAAGGELQAAAMIAIGRTPVPLGKAPDPALDVVPSPAIPRAATSRQGQLEFLLSCLDAANRGEASHPESVLAHAPGAIVRLLADLPDDVRAQWKVRAWSTFRSALDSEESGVIQHGVTLALGGLADADEDPIDVEMRSALTRRGRDTEDFEGRPLALIALAQAGCRAEVGEVPVPGLAEVRGELHGHLIHSRGATRRAAALSLGILGTGLRNAGGALDPNVDEALRKELRETRRPFETRAYALALGLRQDQASVPLLLEKLASSRVDSTSRDIALAVGLVGQPGSIPTLELWLVSPLEGPRRFEGVAGGLALLEDREHVATLAEGLMEALDPGLREVLARTLGRVGDARCVEPLVDLVLDESTGAKLRVVAAMALGEACDRDAVPWTSRLSADLNHLAVPEALAGILGR